MVCVEIHLPIPNPQYFGTFTKSSTFCTWEYYMYCTELKETLSQIPPYINYLCTYDLYGPVRKVLDLGR
jgi:hypothetical protein